jgi:hypothetical protein
VLVSIESKAMKHPITPPDQINRRNAAEEATIIIGDPGAAQTSIAPPTPSPAPAPGVAVAPVIQPPMAAKPIASDPGHTRILGYSGSVEGLKTDPVVGWLVVLDGPGKGNFRAVYSGSNTIGRSSSQRIPIDFGDDSISSEKQAFLVYDGRKRQYQLVPNLERPNLVHLNDSALLANAEIKAHDKVTLGRTTLLFVPLCGPDFDWGDMAK